MKTFNVQIPEGYEIDKEKSTFEQIVFKKKENNKPKTWEEYIEQMFDENPQLWYVQGNSEIVDCYLANFINDERHLKKIAQTMRNTLPSREIAEKMLALCQLISLRKAWVGEWEPKFCIEPVQIITSNLSGGTNVIASCYATGQPARIGIFSFPNYTMAKDFQDCFNDLLKKAWGLY